MYTYTLCIYTTCSEVILGLSAGDPSLMDEFAELGKTNQGLGFRV